MRGAVLLLLIVVAAPESWPQPPARAAVNDVWSPVIGWKAHTGQTFAGIHATLMKDGRILLFGVDSPFGYFVTPPPVGSAPAEITLRGFRTPVEFPEPGLPFGPFLNIKDTLYCAGHTTMADGSVFVVGGTRTLSLFTPGGLATLFVGLDYASVLGSSPVTWRRIPEKMKGTGELNAPDRWYPQVTRLPDGRMLATAGADYVVPPAATSTNRSVEVYTPGATGAAAWTVLSTHQQSPQEI
ncbi:MAG TPA: hypothetical protein VIX63_00380, partial [Vicinamibacterales bacterium]